MDAAESGSNSSYRQKLRRNGTYLVFRQLEQDVPAFNAFVAEAANKVYGNAGKQTQDKFAALLVGRELDGTPLVQSKASGGSSQNDFLYYNEDRSGMACPIGAHIRRANPRDTVGPDPDTSLRLSKMHRIIRRGRPYGEKLDASSGNPANQAAAARGMLFIALNADIAGQFEMIQHSWLNNTHFGGLYAGTDPFGHFECPADVVAIQNRPANLYIERPRPFVRVRGGAYFFMPGIEAVAHWRPRQPFNQASLLQLRRPCRSGLVGTAPSAGASRRFPRVGVRDSSVRCRIQVVGILAQRNVTEQLHGISLLRRLAAFFRQRQRAFRGKLCIGHSARPREIPALRDKQIAPPKGVFGQRHVELLGNRQNFDSGFYIALAR